jgi:hypothetical protein
MKKKLVGIFVCSFLLVCSFSLSLNARYINNNEIQLYNENVVVHYPNPLIFRVEYEQIIDRVWIFRGFATNTLEEKISIRFHTIPFQISFFYLLSDIDDSIFVGTYYTKKPYLIYGDNLVEFEPDEEKLINSVLFFGISNRILWGYLEGYKKHIDSWPILPKGEYEIRATLNPYRNENYETLSTGISDTFDFDYY